nr:hypothetical protein [Tanacetum cinerariifolium]
MRASYEEVKLEAGQIHKHDTCNCSLLNSRKLKGECCWWATRGVVKESEVDHEEGNREGGNEGVGVSADVYWNMSVVVEEGELVDSTGARASFTGTKEATLAGEEKNSSNTS